MAVRDVRIFLWACVYCMGYISIHATQYRPTHATFPSLLGTSIDGISLVTPWAVSGFAAKPQLKLMGMSCKTIYYPPIALGENTDLGSNGILDVFVYPT